MGGRSDYKKIMILCSVLAVGIIIISVIYALCKDDTKPSGGKNNTVVSQIPVKDGEEIWTNVMILGVELDSSLLIVKNLETGEEQGIIFTGGSDIRTRSGRAVSAGVLQKGNIVKIRTDEDGKLAALMGLDNVWTYKNVENIRIDEELGKIEAGSSLYHIAGSMQVLNKDEFTDISTLVINGTDILDLYGIGDYVYLIKVSTGHGYLTLENIEAYEGGNIYFGLGKTAVIEEDLKLTLREGEYEVNVENNGLSADAVIKINRDEVTCFNLEPYGPEPVEYGDVTLNISPKESELYVDGVRTDFTGALQLTLGTHDIEVELGGYNGYKGTIEVGKDGLTKNITLSEAPEIIPEDIIYEEENPGTVTAAPIPTVAATPTPIQNPDIPDDYKDVDIPDSTTDNGTDGNIEVIDGDETDTVTPVKTGSGKLTVYCSDGANVYIDGVYKGRISGGSLTIDKPSGTVTLELKKDGYVTKKYTLTMDDDEEEQVFRFPDMTKS